MYCPQCGVPNDETARYCTACGAVLPLGAAPGSTAGGASGMPSSPQQQLAQPPPYQQVPPQPAYYQPPPLGTYTAPPSVPTHMGWAIACFFLCFWPTAIVAIVYASRVNKKLVLGDYPAALTSSRRARTWCWVSFGILVAAIVIAVIAGATSAG